MRKKNFSYKLILKRPMVLAAAVLAAGIITGQYIGINGCIALIVLSIIISIVTGILTRARFVYMVPILFVLGICLILYANMPDKIYNGTSAINGAVHESYISDKGEQRILIKTKEIYNNGKAEETEKYVIVYLEEGIYVKEGDLLVVKGRLQLPQKAFNPGGFDNFIYMKNMKYNYTMFSNDVIKYGEEHRYFMESVSKLRKSVNNVFDICLPEDISPVAKAIVTGNTSYLDDNIRDLYSNAGIAHMLAVSGLHTTIISVMISAFFMKILKFKKRYASLAVMPLMAVYLIFVGGKAAAARAVIMMEVIYFGDVINRKPDTLNSVGFAAFVLLIINPYQLFWSGFLLSFVTVSGLIFIADGIGKGRRLKDKAFAAVKTSFLTSAASFPVVSWFFYKIPVLGFIVNLITTPLIGIAVCFGMLAGIAGLFSIKAAVFLCGPVYIILKFYFIVCTFFTSLPISVLLTGKPTLMFCIAYYVNFIFLYAKRKRGILLNTGFILCMVLMFVSVAGDSLVKKNNTVSFLYVGQGDCTVINTYDNKTFVVDGGGNQNTAIGENTGIKYVIPFLESKGIKRIDALFITHMDTDHAAGCIELIKYYDVNKVFISNAHTNEMDILVAVLKEAAAKGISVERISAGDIAEIGENSYIECLYPYAGITLDDENNNHTSLVLKFVFGEISFLLTGDADEYDERLMILGGQDIEADVYKAGHHGSKTSSSERFLNNVKPEYAVISCGINNVYGHPNGETLKRLVNTDIKIYNTSLDGAVTFTTDGKGLSVNSYTGGREYGKAERRDKIRETG